jgi:chemotaxis protein MotB
MFKRRSHNDQSNFWISYADLMAGLLFVFILLIGAIVSKSMIMREDLHKKQEKLGQTEVALMEKMEKLDIAQDKLKKLTTMLNQRELVLRDINSSLVDAKMKVAKQKEKISTQEQMVSTQQGEIAEKRAELTQKQREIARKKQELLEKKRALTETKQVVEQKAKEITEKKKVIAQKTEEIVQKKLIITEQEEKIRLQAAEVRKLHLLLSELQNSMQQANKKNMTLSSRVVVLGGDLNRTKQMLFGQKELSQTKEERIGQLQALITLTKDSLKLKESELEKLNQLLLARNSKVDTLSNKVVLLQNLIQESNTTLEQKQKKLQEYVGRVIVLSNSLTDKEDELKLKDAKLVSLLEAVDKKKTKYDTLITKLQSQRAQIKSLTGIKLKVISALKETLGAKINIDRSSGALRLSSNILFDKGSSALKEESKTELKSAFEDYIGALVTNEAIRPHLDRIVIEGHTDSDGTYLLNLKLSQERALAVMNYLLTLPIAQKYNLKKYLVASGRAYLDNIKRNGLEDKDASRRIEIKFQLKNQDAMHEIERILDDGKQLF